MNRPYYTLQMRVGTIGYATDLIRTLRGVRREIENFKMGAPRLDAIELRRVKDPFDRGEIVMARGCLDILAASRRFHEAAR